MQSFGVVVAGAGAAGMVAALAAAEAGARVLLLERDLALPSTFAVSGGLFSAAGTRWQAAAGVEDSPARFAADIRAKAGEGVEPLLLRLVTEGAAEVAEFLDGPLGIPLHLHGGALWPGHSAARLHATEGESGAGFAALLRAAIARRPRIAVQDGAVLTGLLPGITGVAYDQDGRRRTADARGVVLATGGYGAAPELLARFAPEAAAAVHVGGAASDGTGLRLAEAAGADLACMDAYQGQPHVSPHRIGDVRPRFGAALPALGALLVNRAGRRFAREDLGPSELTGHLLSLPGSVAVEFWGEAAQQAALAGGPFRRAVELGAVQRFDDLTTLAACFGLPAPALAETVAEAGRAARGEAPDRFGRQRWGTPPVAPFFAAEVTGALAHTQGGVRVDERAQVLRADGSPIPRLFAAGGVACGISGRGAAGYLPGNGLSQAFVLGLRAGRAAVRG